MIQLVIKTQKKKYITIRSDKRLITKVINHRVSLNESRLINIPKYDRKSRMFCVNKRTEPDAFAFFV